MSNRPPIYAHCPAGCDWETIHKDDFIASASLQPLQEDDETHITELIPPTLCAQLTDNPMSFKIHDGTSAATGSSTWNFSIKIYVYLDGTKTLLDTITNGTRAQFSHDFIFKFNGIASGGTIGLVNVYYDVNGEASETSIDTYYLDFPLSFEVENTGATATPAVAGSENTKAYKYHDCDGYTADVGLWYSGTAVTGTGTSISAEVAGSKKGDMYLNSETSNVYCATAANTWDYAGNIHGEAGASDLRLEGKKVVCFGDSICGNYVAPNDYPSVISTFTGATTYNVGFGGCCMCEYTNENYAAFSMPALTDSIVSGTWTRQDAVIGEMTGNNRPEHLALLKTIDFNEIDYITIAYGVNDWIYGMALDNDADDDDVSSYLGAVRYAVRKLLANYPHLKIHLLTPMYRVTLTDGAYVSDSDTDICPRTAGTLKLGAYIDGLKSLSDEFHIPVIDMYHGHGVNKYNYETYLIDGVHPTAAGIEAIGRRVSEQLLSANGANNEPDVTGWETLIDTTLTEATTSILYSIPSYQAEYDEFEILAFVPTMSAKCNLEIKINTGTTGKFTNCLTPATGYNTLLRIRGKITKWWTVSYDMMSTTGANFTAANNTNTAVTTPYIHVNTFGRNQLYLNAKTSIELLSSLAFPVGSYFMMTAHRVK